MIGNITFKCRYCGKSLNSGKHKQLLCKKKYQKMLDRVVKKNMNKLKKLTGQELYCYKGYDPDGYFIAGIAEEEVMKNHILVMKDKINELIERINLLIPKQSKTK